MKIFKTLLLTLALIFTSLNGEESAKVRLDSAIQALDSAAQSIQSSAETIKELKELGIGVPGPAGPQGEKGERGEQGERGEKGEAAPKIFNGATFVKTFEELALAIVQQSRLIVLESDIEATRSLVIDFPLVLYSPNKNIIKFNGEQIEYLFDVRSSFYVNNITINGSSQSFGRIFNIGGNRYVGDFDLFKCNFSNVGNIVSLTGGPTSNTAPNISIEKCKITKCGSSSFNKIGKDGAISLGWNLAKVKIVDNEISEIWSNGIWVGESKKSSGEISRNHITKIDRNAIETFYADNLLVNDNVIMDVTGKAGGSGMGISLAGSNSIASGNFIKNIYAYGIEVYNNGNLVTGNTIDTILINKAGEIGLGISVDRCTNALISDNILTNIKYGSAAPKFAIQIGNNSSNVKIINNKFVDVTEGVRMLFCENCQVLNNDFTLTWDDNTLAASCQPAVIIFNGDKHLVANNIARMKRSGNIAGLFYIAANRKVFADFSGKQVLGGVSGAGFGNRIGANIANSSNLCVE